MRIDRNGFQRDDEPVEAAEAAPETDSPASEAAVQAALAGLSGHEAGAAPKKESRPGELKYKLTSMLFPSILLIFVALYVTSLASRMEPEMALFWSGGAGLVLAILARAAVSILADDTRLVLNDTHDVAPVSAEAMNAYLAGSGGEQGAAPGSGGADQPSTAASAAGTGGKE